VGAITRIMHETEPPSGTARAPLTDSFRDLWLRAIQGRPALWRHRLREHWADYLRAYQWEAVNRTAGVYPGLFAFLCARRDSIGVQTCLDLVERCGRYTLPDDVHAAFPLAAMRQLTEEVVIFVNDIASLDKELATGDVNNSVLVLRHEQDCTLPQAVQRVGAMADIRVQRFQRLATHLTDTAFPSVVRADLEHYVDGMRHIMRGNLDWSLETGRYGDAGIAAVSDGRQRPWANLINLPAQGR
jgi:pentalenene synthase